MTASAAINYRRVGPGKLYMVAAPTASTTGFTGTVTESAYYGLFYSVPASPKPSNLNSGLQAYCNANDTGLDIKIKQSKAKFSPCIGTTTEMVTGIDTATCGITMFDVDPAHLVDMFGGNVADLVSIAAATGTAARSIALLGPQSYNTCYTLMYEMPSSVVPGEFFHYIFPNVSIVCDTEIKANKKDAMDLKLEFQLMVSPFVNNSAGFGVVMIADDPTAPGL